jgi:AcrR family transcriptional regulator
MSVAPRQRNAQATRAALLEAARVQFETQGYDCATLRDIARAAGADVALIKRYFGGKEALFTEALRASFHPGLVSEWNRQTFARDFALAMAGSPYDNAERTRSFQFLLHAATSPTTAPLLNTAVRERFLEPIREWLGDDDEGASARADAGGSARARVLAAVVIGFLVERLIRAEPLTGAEREAFIERAAATFESIVA